MQSASMYTKYDDFEKYVYSDCHWLQFLYIEPPESERCEHPGKLQSL